MHLIAHDLFAFVLLTTAVPSVLPLYNLSCSNQDVKLQDMMLMIGNIDHLYYKLEKNNFKAIQQAVPWE